MPCKTCGCRFERFSTRKSYVPVKKKVSGHIHYGTVYFRYGLCGKNHYTKLNRDRVEWSYCYMCRNVKKTLEKKRRFLEAKQRREKKRVPSFLRHEYERFKKEEQEQEEQYREIYEDPKSFAIGRRLDQFSRPNVVKETIREELREELKEEVREEVREKLAKEVSDDIRKDLREEIREELKTTMRLDIMREIRQNLKIQIFKEMESVMKHQVENTLNKIIPNSRYGSYSQPNTPEDRRCRPNKVYFSPSSQPSSPTASHVMLRSRTEVPSPILSPIPPPPSPPPTPTLSESE